MSENKSSKSDSSTNQCFVIGNYMVSQTIGQGTYGKVRLGSNIQTKEKVWSTMHSLKGGR
jgi:serine/threonine protein kinase